MTVSDANEVIIRLRQKSRVKLPAAIRVFPRILPILKKPTAMTMVLIEVPDEQAALALGQQANVRLVEILAPGQQLVRVPAQPDEAPAKLPTRKWAGALAAISTTSAQDWDTHLHEIRNEWERDI